MQLPAVTSEPFESVDSSAFERSRTRSNAVLISIARGEGFGEAGVGEGGADELESEVWEPLECAGRWLVDTSDGFRRSLRGGPLVGESWIVGMEALRLLRSETSGANCTR